jgi:MoaA/NifB/PqqE/SkfB family radical SAM enzyme
LKIYPNKLRLEISSDCQLKCVACPTAKGSVRAKIGSGKMSLTLLKDLIKNAPWVSEVELSNWGEIFLNSQLPDILEYCFKEGIRVNAANGVNLNNASDKALEAVVKYRVRTMTCSIDGASQDVYKQYRKGGNFDRVISNIRQINAQKEKYRSKFPVLTWQFVIMKQNEHQVEDARRLAGELGMRFVIKPCWDKDLAVRVDKDNAPVKFQGSGWDDAVTKIWDRSCLQLWEQPQIHFDGTLLGCCENFWGDFGAAGSVPLGDILNGPKINAARQLLMGKPSNEKSLPCYDCDNYKSRMEQGRFVEIDLRTRARHLVNRWMPRKFINRLSYRLETWSAQWDRT